MPSVAWWAHVPPVTQRQRRLLFFLVVGLALTACRSRHRSRLTADHIAGRWVIDYIGYTGARGVPHYVGLEPHDTLTVLADGRWWSSHVSTHYTMRHDSLVFPAGAGETAFAVRLIGPGKPRLSLLRRVPYDFNADGLPEWAVQETVFRRVGQGETARPR